MRSKAWNESKSLRKRTWWNWKTTQKFSNQSFSGVLQQCCDPFWWEFESYHVQVCVLKGSLLSENTPYQHCLELCSLQSTWLGIDNHSSRKSNTSVGPRCWIQQPVWPVLCKLELSEFQIYLGGPTRTLTGWSHSLSLAASSDGLVSHIQTKKWQN